MSIDPNIYTGAVIMLIGILIGFALCFTYEHARKWFVHRSSLRQLALRKKTREDDLQAKLHKQAISQQAPNTFPIAASQGIQQVQVPGTP